MRRAGFFRSLLAARCLYPGVGRPRVRAIRSKTASIRTPGSPERSTRSLTAVRKFTGLADETSFQPNPGREKSNEVTSYEFYMILLHISDPPITMDSDN
jgi:hypothetical protein